MQEQLEIETGIEKNKVRSLLFSIGIIIFVGITFTIPFLQVFFPVKSKSVINAMEAYDKIDNAKLEAEEKLKSFVYDYQSNKINGQEFKTEIDKYIPLIQNLEYKSEVLFSDLQKAKAKDKVFGFRTSKEAVN
ncbi:hypothetical protein [Aquimarina algiphila]|uniref:hypothetical protein n=1 Tax=Aquimarina algiphila TaxID=2047982 RepID=UPI002330CB10|nr:hypothetical protein [Aquimarina algiphila]